MRGAICNDIDFLIAGPLRNTGIPSGLTSDLGAKVLKLNGLHRVIIMFGLTGGGDKIKNAIFYKLRKSVNFIFS